MRPITCLFTSLLLFLLSPISGKASVTILPQKEKDKTTDDFCFVGTLENISNNSAGSGTVIGDGSFALTARHVVTHNGETYGMILDPSNFVFTINNIKYNVEKIYADNPNDIAIIKLSGIYQNPVKIHNSGNLSNTIFYGAGYGKSSSDAKYDFINWDIEYGNLRIFKNKISGQIINLYVKDNTLKITTEYFFSLSNPDDDFAIDGEGMFGPGDSGGGIFVFNNDQPEIIGVIKALSIEYPIIGYFVDIYACKEWIEKIVPNAFAEEKFIPSKDSETKISSLSFDDNACALMDKRRKYIVNTRKNIHKIL